MTLIFSAIALITLAITVRVRKTIAYFVFAAGLAIIIAFLGLLYRAIRFTI
ncbi:hypothetical protein [Mucilaginibacter auburnensis]|nr:hypothetical protein [Mucilaginibacter auburnensis]